ncbi:MAG: hypothetical protein PVI90_08730 [Desulfobacteraceae bacterium]|jgi:hypothetical protein
MSRKLLKYFGGTIVANFLFWIVILSIFGLNTYAQEQKTSKVFSGPAIDPKDAKPFKLTATIMEINAKARIPNIVVAEKIILVTDYKLGGQTKSTRLLGNYGQTMTITDLEKDKRVVVDGLKLTDGTFVGEKVQMKEKRK